METLSSNYISFERTVQSEFPKQNFEIIAVSKTKPYEVIKEAYQAGIRLFGENYIPEAIEKFTRLFEEFPEAKDAVRLHHIGPTQSGTLRKLIGFFYATHGVGSFRTAEELMKRALKEQKKIHYFFQCNVSGETTKNGLEMDELYESKSKIASYQNEYCELLGFMGMGPSSGDETKTREAFALLSQFRSDFFPNLKLSMGMSGDYAIALEYKSDFIRIGSKIFGERKYNE